MKHQYFGDISDYRKYGLLRCIADVMKVRIGILWLLTKSDGRSDGEFRRYLQQPARWRHHDEDLYDGLLKLLHPDQHRHVGNASHWNIVPNARYFEREVTDSAADRRHFFADAEQYLADCPVIFVDPDNGIEVKSVRYGAKGSSKFVYWRELESLYRKGHSLVIYQHYPRIAREEFRRRLASECMSRLGGASVVICSTAHVAFVLITQPESSSRLADVVEEIKSRWHNQFDIISFNATEGAC